MKIILNKDVQNLGEEGDIREVARGYARNYLIPKGFGVAYTKQNLALLEGRRKAIEKRKEEKRDRAAGLRERIEALSLTIPMTVGETGRLFGSVTNAMISEELAKLGVEVERKRIEIPEHTIKMVGNYVVKVRLYGSEVASLKVSVTGPAGKTAEAQEAEGEKGEEPQEAEAQASEDTSAEAGMQAVGQAVAEAVDEAAAEAAAEAEEAASEAAGADAEPTTSAEEESATEPEAAAEPESEAEAEGGAAGEETDQAAGTESEEAAPEETDEGSAERD